MSDDATISFILIMAERRRVPARFLEPVILARMPVPAGHYERIYAVVSRIPRGRVATYGQVARLASLAGQARLVGYALSALDDQSRVPWHRVVNVRGEISLRRDSGPASIVQRLRLKRERVRFDARNRIPLDLFRWRPRR